MNKRIFRPSLSFALALTAGAIVALPSPASADLDADVARPVITHYANTAAARYQAARDGAVKLQQAIDALLAQPTQATLDQARQAWLAARTPYNVTEVYRYFESPIDQPATGDQPEGPESRLNSWPVNEAAIDAVKGNPKAGIIHDLAQEISPASLASTNQAADEADVTVGYHAIEFLLWGQDFSVEGPGDRSFEDYLPGDPIRERRRSYLRSVTQLLVHDLQQVADGWQGEPASAFRTRFASQPPQQSIQQILTGLATLAGFELASERIAVALQSGDQEDEHSCFSDNTHNDLIDNVRSLEGVYLGQLTPEDASASGPGLTQLVAAADKSLDQQIRTQLATCVKLARSIQPPLDQILASAPDDPRRQPLEQLSKELFTLSKLLVQAGQQLGVQVIVAAE